MGCRLTATAFCKEIGIGQEKSDEEQAATLLGEFVATLQEIETDKGGGHDAVFHLQGLGAAMENDCFTTPTTTRVINNTNKSHIINNNTNTSHIINNNTNKSHNSNDSNNESNEKEDSVVLDRRRTVH